MKALVLSNLGTPSAPTPEALRAYLGEFLMDEGVIALPFPLRWLLVHGLILRTRPRRSAEAYQKIWTQEGSPLLVWGRALQLALQAELGPEWKVTLGMRYGRPSLADAIDELGLHRGVTYESLVLFPLYPHFSHATSGSTRAAFDAALRTRAPGASYKVVEPFFADSGWLEAWSTPPKGPTAFTLFSFHGLPETHPGAREYERQCIESARLLAAHLGLAEGAWTHGFQSRLGPTRWLGPSTDDLLRRLPSQGHASVRVLAPSFVADCLETLEELGLRSREVFLGAGGKAFELAPCPNAGPAWAATAANLVRQREAHA